MATRKERSLKQLYELTDKLKKARGTPILEGKCKMQGPVDELDSKAETDLVGNNGNRVLVGSSSEHMGTTGTDVALECDNHTSDSIVDCGDSTSVILSIGKITGKDMYDKGNTRNSTKKDSIEIEETLASVSRRRHDHLKRPRVLKSNIGDLASNSSDCDAETEKGVGENVIGENEKVVKRTDSSLSYCKGNLISSGEQSEENHVECHSSQEPQKLLQAGPLPCESAVGVYLNVSGSKDITQVTDLNAQDYCDDIDMKETIDLREKLPSRKENVGNETDLNNTCATKGVEKNNLDMFSNISTSLTAQRNQTEIQSNQLQGESVYNSPDFVPDSNLDIHVISSEHKENISEIYVNDDSCNMKCEKRNFVIGGQSTQEKVHNPIDNLMKLTENSVHTISACSEEIPCMVVKKVDSGGIGNSIVVTDEVKFTSEQDHDTDISCRISTNANVKAVDVCADPHLKEMPIITYKESMKLVKSSPIELSPTGSPMQKESENKHIVEGNISQEVVSSSSISVTQDLFSANYLTMTNVIESKSICQQGQDLVPACSSSQMGFPSSKKPVVTTMQENIDATINLLGAVQSPKDPEDGCPKTSSEAGFLVMKTSQSSSQPSMTGNQVLAEVTPDSQTALEQPSHLVIDKNSLSTDADNKMDLDRLADKYNVDVGPSETKEPLVTSEPVLEDNSNDPDMVEDDVKVCDICGDAGLEEKLAICSMCNDGAEHIYCMQTMLDKVPEGNWFCEGCKSPQNGSSKNIEVPQNGSSKSIEVPQNDSSKFFEVPQNGSSKNIEVPQNNALMSKPACSSSRNQITNCSSNTRLSAKMDRKRYEPELKRLVKGISNSQSLIKRRAEDLEVGPATKKQALDVRSAHQGISNSNGKPVISRDNSFKAVDTGRTKPSLSVALTGNQFTSGLHNSGKPSTVSGAQSPRFYGTLQSTKGKYTSVNSLASESSPCIGLSNNALSSVLSTLTDKGGLSVKAADAGLPRSPHSRLINSPRTTSMLKIKKDFSEVDGQASTIRESTSSGLMIGGLNKTINKSSSFKLKAGITSGASIIETSISTDVQHASCLQTKEIRVGKPRKDGTDLSTRKTIVKSGSAASNLVSLGDLPLCSKTSTSNSSVSQATPRVISSKKETSTPKSLAPEGKLCVGSIPVVLDTIKEECTPTTFSGSTSIKLEPFASSGALCYSSSQISTEQCNSISISGTKSMAVIGTSFSLDRKSCISTKNKLAEGSAYSFENSNNDDKTKNFALSTWSSPRNLLQVAGSTRCYKCKELGHTAQFCSSRISPSTSNSSLRVSTLKHSAARNSRDISGSSSGKWNNFIEASAPGYKSNCENVHTSEQRILPVDKQEPEGRPENSSPGQVSANSDSKCALFSKEAAGICEKVDGESFVSRESSMSICDLGRDVPIGLLDAATGISKDSSINHSSSIVTLGVEVASPTNLLKNAKWNSKAQIHSSQTMYVDGEGPLISLGDFSKFMATSTTTPFTVHPTESTVTAVRRDVSCAPPSDGNYAGTHLRVIPFQHSSQVETVKSVALPEHNFLWQGGFEVRSKGNPSNYYEGLQAHASTCAAPKVFDAAMKLPSRVLLEEVPRLSSWPLRFQCSHPCEENIALYFFAKDIESYERSYKMLLEHMLKNDFALRGNFDGVELLIFPSNQLPEKSQRWNRLLYLWGVFRERKATCIEASAYPQERTPGQLSASTLSAGNVSAKVPPPVQPSLPRAGFPETEEMDIDVEGGPDVSLSERGLNGLGRENSPISLFLPSFSSRVDGKTKDSKVQSVSDFVEQKLPSVEKNDEFPGEDILSSKKCFPKSSFDSIHESCSQVPYMNRANDLDSSVEHPIVVTQKYHPPRGNIVPQKEKQTPADAEDGKFVEFQASGLPVGSQISSRRERMNSAYFGHILSGPVAISSSSLERQDHSSDSSKTAQVSPLATSGQTNSEKERNKLKDEEYDRWRERGKDMEDANFRNNKELKLREREKERDRERNGEITTERESNRRISSRRHEEHSSHDTKHHRDSRQEKRHRYSHSPPRHVNRVSFPSVQMNNHDYHHSRTRSPEFDQIRYSQPLSGSETCRSRHRDLMSPKGRSFNDHVADERGQKRLKKSYSEIYVRENYKEQDTSGRSSSGKSSSETNISSHSQQVGALSISTQHNGSSALEHSQPFQREGQEYSLLYPRDSQMTETFFFSESMDTERDYNTARSSEQKHIKSISKHNSPERHSAVQFVSSVEGENQELLDVDAPNLELALGAKKTSPKPGPLPLFVQLLDKTSQEQLASPTTSEDGSSLSLSLTFPLSEKEQSVKSVLKENQALPSNRNVDTSLLLFGGGVDG